MVSTAHFCKSISDQSLLVLETLVLLHSLCMDQWAGKGGIVSGGGEEVRRHVDVKHELFTLTLIGAASNTVSLTTSSV